VGADIAKSAITCCDIGKQSSRAGSAQALNSWFVG